MGRLNWDLDGERLYETGIDQVILFPMNDNGTYGNGVAWNGITAINETASGAEASPLYADNIKYLELRSDEELSLSIEAYMSPEEFDACDGTVELAPGVSITAQTRRSFGLAYRTRIGNDIKKDDYGYKWHLVYGCTASPTDYSHSTTNESPEAGTLSWEVTTNKLKVAGKKPTAKVEIDSTKVLEGKLAAFEEAILGVDAVEEDTDNGIEAVAEKMSRLPLPAEIATMFAGSQAG